MREFVVARYTANGSLDRSFGDGLGFVATRFPSAANQQITAIIIDSNHKIIAGGVIQTPEGMNHIAVARYCPDGTLDKSFGDGTGRVTVDFNCGRAVSFALTRDEKIVAGSHMEGQFFWSASWRMECWTRILAMLASLSSRRDFLQPQNPLSMPSLLMQINEL